jgi:Domain of unknown function (DUF6895)
MKDILLDRALDWIDTHLSEFDPLWKAEEFDFKRGQRLGELAILARTATAIAGQGDDPRVCRMVSLLRRTQSAPVYRDRVLRAPIEFMLFLEVYATLRALGRDDELMRSRLRKAIAAGWLDQTERFPHRTMDIRSCAEACGIESGLPTLDELYRRSILGTPPNPILLNENDLYALTHVVMFSCDFGMRSPELVPSGDIDAVAALLSAVSVVAARDHHWDLLAEFLLCWSCLELQETGLITKAWDALVRAQSADGAVPGPEASDVPAFETVYHTTLVCALAASVRRANRTPDRESFSQRAGLSRTFHHTKPDLKEVATRAREWLSQTLEKEQRTPTVAALRLGQTLIGLSCCSALTGDGPPTGPIRAVVRQLSDAVTVVDWEQVPPLLQCAWAAWVAEGGVFVAALHGENGFLRRASSFIRHTAVGTGRHAVEMSEIWFALHQLGMAPCPPTISEADMSAYGKRIAIDSDPRDLEELLLLLDASTANGSRKVRLDDESRWLTELVAGLAVDACRRYDLMKAADVLRVGMAIAAEHSRASHVLGLCAEYLIFNQREDGAFGVLGPERAIRHQLSGCPGDDNDYLLPLTVNCLRALAECFRDWRLLTELGARGEAVRAMTLR